MLVNDKWVVIRWYWFSTFRKCMLMYMNDSGWERLAQHIAARRIDLGYDTQAALANAAELSRVTIVDLEGGRRTSYSRTTIARLERALRWDVGSVRAILNGEGPTERPTPNTRPA